MTCELYLGFASGEVIAYRADRDQAVTVGKGAGAVAGLGVDPTGKTLVMLRQFDREAVLSSFRKHPDGSFRLRPDVHFSVAPQSWVTAVLPLGVERLVGLSDGRDLWIIDAASGMIWLGGPLSLEAWAAPSTAFLLPADSLNRSPQNRLIIVTHDGPRWIFVDEHGEFAP